MDGEKEDEKEKMKNNGDNKSMNWFKYLFKKMGQKPNKRINQKNDTFDDELQAALQNYRYVEKYDFSKQKDKTRKPEFPEFEGRLVSLQELCRAKVRRIVKLVALAEDPTLLSDMNVPPLLKPFIGTRHFSVERRKVNPFHHNLIQFLHKDGIIHGVTSVYKNCKSTFVFFIDDHDEAVLYKYYAANGSAEDAKVKEAERGNNGTLEQQREDGNPMSISWAVEKTDIFNDPYSLFPTEEELSSNGGCKYNPGACGGKHHGPDANGHNVFSSFILNCTYVQTSLIQHIQPSKSLRIAMDNKINKLDIPTCLKSFLTYNRGPNDMLLDDALLRSRVPLVTRYILKAARENTSVLYCLELESDNVRLAKCLSLRV